jgi:hypothetical protein
MRPERSLYRPYAAALDQDFQRRDEDACGEQDARPREGLRGSGKAWHERGSFGSISRTPVAGVL